MTFAKKSHHNDNLNTTIRFLENGISLYEDFTVVANISQWYVHGVNALDLREWNKLAG